MTEPRHVATGESYGALAHAEHARQAVTNAKAQLGNTPIASVVLFLSGAYAHQPQAAIKEAVKAAGTPMVYGCCAAGLLTEREWLLDVEGAVAMVFSSELALQPINIMQQQNQSPGLAFSLSTPNASSLSLNTHNYSQFGAIASDEFGDGPFSIWQSGQIAEREYLHAAFPIHLQHSIQVAHSVRAISPIMQINRSEEHRLIELDQSKPIDNLIAHLPAELREKGLRQAYSVLAAVSADNTAESIERGNFELHHVISSRASVDDSQEVQLSEAVKSGRHMAWAVRDANSAEEQMRDKLAVAKSELSQQPQFAMMFSNIGRGAEFYHGKDRDHELFCDAFPTTPMIGFYSNGEVAPFSNHSNLIHRYSSVFGVFA